MMFWDKEDNLIERARKLAYKVHKGQERWGGEPFIVHPKGVVEKLRDMDILYAAYRGVYKKDTYPWEGRSCFMGEDMKHDYYVVGWLHDVVEDTSTTLGDLLDMGFDYHIVEAVDAITRRDGEDYREYILRVKTDVIARYVKIADIGHNLESFDHKKNKSRADKYKLAVELLKNEDAS